MYWINPNKWIIQLLSGHGTFNVFRKRASFVKMTISDIVARQIPMSMQLKNVNISKKPEGSAAA